MVTGRRAFSGQSIVTLLADIMEKDPTKVSEIIPSVPLDLEKLISRTMRKAPERRFHTMEDVRVGLQDIKAELDSGSFVSAEALRSVRDRKTGRWLWAAAGIVTVVLGVAGGLYFSSPDVALPPPRTIPLTSYQGGEFNPAISPDGNQVAFTRVGESGARDLYVMMIDSREPLLISRGSRNIFGPAWSPDGRQIAFISVVTEEG